MNKDQIKELKNIDISKGFTIDKHLNEKIFDNTIEKLKKTLKIRLKKSAATMVMGSIRRWGVEQIAHKKTPQGWVRVKEDKPKVSRIELKQFHKEMREEHGGGWIGPALIKYKMNLVRLLENEGKAQVEQLGQGHYRVRFFKSVADFGE